MYVTVELVSLVTDAPALAAAASPRAIAMARAAAASIEAVTRAIVLVGLVPIGTTAATTRAPIAIRTSSGDATLTSERNAAGTRASRSRSQAAQTCRSATSSSPLPETVCGERYNTGLVRARPIGVAPARLSSGQACSSRTNSPSAVGALDA